jgi:tetratricopeptide (TPR) repeat protein
MRARQLVIASTLLGLGLAAFPSREAHAQSAGAAYPPPCSASAVPQSESERAHTIYQAGKVQYDDKNYDAAIVQFRDAYKRDCSKHDLLIIISRAYELKGDKVEALRALETYVERVPNSPDIMTHRNGIDSLKKQIAAQPATPPPAAGATAPAAPPQEVREHTIPPWIVVGAGGIAIIAGVVVLATAPKAPNMCDASSETCTHITGESADAFAKRQQEAGRAKNQPLYGGIVIGGGAALVVGGLLWHFLEPTGPVEKSAALKPKLTPQVTPGYAGVSLGGSF